MKSIVYSAFCFTLLLTAPLTSKGQLIWAVGIDDEGWPMGDGGGPNASFVQENGTINALPGVPNSPEVNQQADNDYYFAGDYSFAIDSAISYYGFYAPVGPVAVNEEAAERAFAGADNDLRYHFNLPADLQPTDLLTVTFDANNLHTDGQADPRYGVEIYFNGVLVQPEIVIRPAQFNVDYTTPQFTLASVNAQVGPGYDNVISLKGISYANDGGGAWMGIDYVQLNRATTVIPPAVFPWACGKDDNSQPRGDGGGPNASFVQENGTINPLPGSPTSPEVDRQADNDYYFAGDFRNTINSVVAKYGAYTPVGLVPVNEEAAERAFAGDDNDLRYHFNLPNNLGPNDRVAVTFDALSLHTDGQPDPRYGVEVYFNGVLVQPQIVIRPGQLHQTITTPPFTLGSVNAAVGSGFDNIVSLRGISYANEGGGAWMGIDYVQLDRATTVIPPAVLPWSVGMDDNGWPFGDGGGSNATFVAESGVSNPLPGYPANEEFDGDADDDYYFAGAYTSIVPGNGTYVPVGLVPVNEEAVSRGFSGEDNTLRIHFNLPDTLKPDDLLTTTFDALTLDTSGADPRYGVEIYFNGVLVQTQVVVRAAQLGRAITSPRFTAGSVNAQVGQGFDNILMVKGINYSATGGGNSIGFDYVRLVPIPRSTFPWAVGRDDDAWPAGDGGGPNTSFVQENGGINALPGRPNNPEVNQQSDNDYYFAGEYTTTIPSVVARYGNYTPVGVVLANEEGAERAFAAADNDLRYHFNLPTTLGPNDKLAVTFDANNLHMENADPRYGIEVWFNGVMVQSQIVIRPPQLGIDYTTPPFTLASVNARTGLGFDNIVSLRGINYNNDGGGNWMGIDYVQLNPVVNTCPTAVPFTFAVNQNSSTSTNLPASDPEGNTLTYSITAAPANGTAVVQATTGVVTYTPAPNFCGTDTFKFKVNDGTCDSAEATATVRVINCNACPTAGPVSVSVDQGSSANFNLAGSDPDGNPLTYSVVQPPAHGAVVVQAGSGAATYTPAAGYCGQDSFTYKVNDGRCDSAAGTVSINVRCVNLPPEHCVAAIVPSECTLTTADGTMLVLSPNGSGACVGLQGGATDPEGQPLEYKWSENGVTFASGPAVTHCFELGCHTVTFTATDPFGASCSATVRFCVINPGEAVEQVISLVEATEITRSNKRPLIATLKGAAASFDRGNATSAFNQLGAFQNKVQAQVGRQDPAAAQAFIDSAQRIMEAIVCGALAGGQ